ncbi:hypothetical protein [Prevotella sp. HUN102]|uniref:hypothetical protein n=1 Tax=Prevotella sp. HUN102 TaxID=1392486 RepID=UPI0006898672|nr:hypothetical protein [Prevotella sp. HUN102]
MKQITFNWLLLLLVAVVPGQSWSQSARIFDPYTPEPLPVDAPAWMSEIAKNPSSANFRKMDSLFRAWLANDVDARVKTIERKPAVNFYRRWEKAYRPYVGGNGRIVLPTFDQYLARLDAHNATLRPTTRSGSGATALWRNIGPNATYEHKEGGWQEKDAQVCVYRIAVAPTNHNVVYCGTETGVVFKTTDKGKTWKACRGNHDFGGSVFAVHVSPANENIVYVGGGQSLWKSTDGGETWNREPGIQNRVNSIRINPNDPSHITVCAGVRDDAYGGFFVSRDGGRTYRQTLNGIGHDHELQPSNPLRIYALVKPQGGSGFQFYISEDGGETFNSSALPVSPVAAGRLAVSAAPGGKDYVYALVTRSLGGYDMGVMGGAGEPYLLRSTDGGRNWHDQTTRNGGSDWKNTFSSFADLPNGGQGYFDMTLGVSSTNPDHVIYGLCNAYRSTQGGKGSASANAIGGYIKYDYMHPDIQDIAVAGNDTWIVTDGGVKYSADFFATKGENRHSGIYAADYHGFGQGWNEDIMAGGRWHNGDVLHASAYGQGNTLHVGGVEQSTGHVMLSRPRKAYFSDAAMVIAPESRGGKPQLSYNDMSKKPYETLRTNGEIAFDPRFARRFIMRSTENDDELYLTEDEGRTFRRLYSTEGEMIYSYAFARSNPDYIYLAGAYNIFRSTDNGASWDMLPTRAFDMDYVGSVASSIAVDPKNENKVWHVHNNRPGCVAYTPDGGHTWVNPLSPALKNRVFQWVVLAGDEHNGVYLATMDGASVFYKDDTLTDWIDYSDGLNPGARITRLAPFFKEGKLRAATNQGIWEAPLRRPHFVPVAQPMALNLGNGNLMATPQMEVQFDSYSIVNQDKAKWAWSFSPEPEWVSDATARNPRVRFGRPGVYDVTLQVTTPEGTHSRTMRQLIRTGNAATDIQQPEGIAPEVKMVGVGSELRLAISGLPVAKTFTLHNAKGALLRRLSLSATDTEVRLSTGGLAPGVYLYELRTADFKQFGKILIQ